jgi:hypothetical protein
MLFQNKFLPPDQRAPESSKMISHKIAEEDSFASFSDKFESNKDHGIGTLPARNVLSDIK